MSIGDKLATVKQEDNSDIRPMIREILEGMEQYALQQVKKTGWKQNLLGKEYVELSYRHRRKFNAPAPAWEKDLAARKAIRKELEQEGYQKVSLEVEYDVQVDSYPVLVIRAVVFKAK